MRLYEIQVSFIYGRAIFVVVTSKCHVKCVICTIWTGLSAGTLANSAGPEQTPDQDLYCLRKLQVV